MSAKYPCEFKVMTSFKLGQEIRAIAKEKNISLAQVMREIIERSFDHKCGRREV